MNREKLLKTIVELINLKQEGSYWDFKEKWYCKEEGEKQELLHDIICMANNLENRDGYIIIGIANDYNIVGVGEQDGYNTQNLVDILKDKKFAGDIRPIVCVESLTIEEKRVDIIVIVNSYNTPFYLSSRFKGIQANNIYTRIQDTNTPIDSSADIDKVEQLWKKRFRLLMTPLERVQYYLQQSNDWYDVPIEYGPSKEYYKYFPEFTIQYKHDKSRSGPHFYLLNQSDTTPYWYDISIYYHQTLLYMCSGIGLDGCGYLTSVPHFDDLEVDNVDEKIYLYYFIENSLRYSINTFFYNKKKQAREYVRNKFLECVIIFESKKIKEDFKKFAKSKWKEKEKYSKDINSLPSFELPKPYKKTKFKKRYENMQYLKICMRSLKN